MNRKMKALGLALVAALALTAVMASTASAQFTSSSAHTILHGEQENSHKFTAGAGFGAISCATATFSGTGESTSATSQTITPTYANCKDSLGRTVHIDNTGLHYTFTPDGTVHVSGGMTLTITNGSGSVVCSIHIEAPQTNTGIGYHNLGGTNGVTVTTNSKDVKSVVTGGFFSCGLSEGTYSTGTYEGNTIIKGTDTNGVPVETSVHGNTNA